MALAPTAGGATSLALPGCPDKCGDVLIPYPLGIGAQCAAVSLNSFFNLDCKNTSHPPRPDPGGGGWGSMRPSMFCSSRSTISALHRVPSRQPPLCFSACNTPFLPSPGCNCFTVIGCNTLGILGSFRGGTVKYLAGCYSYCEGTSGASDDRAPCTRTGCCEASIPTNLTTLHVMFPINSSSVSGFNPCFYSMVAEVGWYRFRRCDLVGHLGFVNDRAKSGEPFIVVRNGLCLEPRNNACVSMNSYCESASNGPGYLCKCSLRYEGNAYLNNSCQDIDECMLHELDPKYEELYPCRNGVCHNTLRGYNCKCKGGRKSDGLGVSAVIISSACFFALLLQRKKHKKEKDEYFKQNGGLMLYDEMR